MKQFIEILKNYYQNKIKEFEDEIQEYINRHNKIIKEYDHQYNMYKEKYQKQIINDDQYIMYQEMYQKKIKDNDEKYKSYINKMTGEINEYKKKINESDQEFISKFNDIYIKDLYTDNNLDIGVCNYYISDNKKILIDLYRAAEQNKEFQQTIIRKIIYKINADIYSQELKYEDNKFKLICKTNDVIKHEDVITYQCEY
jgi:hypothetical protein